jgi:hypothetical protein
VNDFVQQQVPMVCEHEGGDQRRELLDVEEVKREMAAMKQEWLAKRKGAF